MYPHFFSDFCSTAQAPVTLIIQFLVSFWLLQFDILSLQSSANFNMIISPYPNSYDIQNISIKLIAKCLCNPHFCSRSLMSLWKNVFVFCILIMQSNFYTERHNIWSNNRRSQLKHILGDLQHSIMYNVVIFIVFCCLTNFSV